MKTLLIALAGTALTTGALATSALAADSMEASGPFDRIKNKFEDEEKKVEQAEAVLGGMLRGLGQGDTGASTGSSAGGSDCHANRGSNSNSPCTARAPGHVGVAGATPEKYKAMTKCANLGIGNAFVARSGDYTFQQGISTEKRSGLIDRREISPVNGCLFEGLGIGDVLYVEFDKSKFQKYDFRIQCVSYDGKEQLDNTFGPRVGNYKGKDVMLHTGNSAGYEPTASGSNSSRSGAYDAYMDKRGRAFTTFNFSSLHTDKAGTDFYCQWFNNDTGESAVALTYRRGPTGG